MKKLRRSQNNKVIAGVCSGIAEWLGWKASSVRLLFIVGSLLPVIPGFVVYIILWIVLPTDQRK